MTATGQARRALRVGLTGGIATGKSRVAALLSDAGIPVIKADDVGHEILAGDPVVTAALAARYGDGILGPSGRPDRDALAAVVFKDPLERRFLEGLLHPVIRAEVNRRIAAHEAAGAALVVVEAALIFEAAWTGEFDRVVVVTCDEATQLARVQARDRVDEETATRRIRAQLPLKDKEALADHLLVNDGTLEELAVQVEELINTLR